MSWTIKSFEDSPKLVESLSKKIISALSAAIEKNGDASLVVSGGSTPKLLFRVLSESHVRWEKVTVTLVDERWVSESHADSNAGLVKEHLIQNNAKSAKFINLTNIDDAAKSKNAKSKKSLTPFTEEKAIEERVSAIRRPFTVVILGMGSDGHTASFFPGASSLEKALYPQDNELCVAVTPPVAPHDRMTLTLPALLQCEHLMLHIVGVDKWRVLQKAIQPGAALELPIRSVLYQYKKILEIFYAAK